MESNSVNPAQGVIIQARELSATYRNGDPPPPYTAKPNSNVVTSQPIIHQTIFVQAPLKLHPEFFTCPDCQQRVLTKVKYINSRKTHLLAGFICGFTSWCLMCCLGALPYIIKTFKKAEHYCPNCEKLLGTFSRI